MVARLQADGIPYHFVEKATLNRLCEGRHQGVMAYVEEFSYAGLEDILAMAETRGEAPFIVALDGVEDPHNLGALIRTAEAAGVHGVIIPARRSAGVTPAVVKVSAGAAAHIAVARVSNLVQTLKILQKKGCWIWGADMAGRDVRHIDLSGAVVWVLGSEGKGLSRLVRETCDEVVGLPMHGQTSSLNVSVAGGILLYQTYLARIPE
jgi:23S rRNA (guanosine2251-2'-O)-methyltransferase